MATRKEMADNVMADYPRHTFVNHGSAETSKLGFSHSRCELCDALPGDRYQVRAVIPGKCDPDPYCFEVCEDCMYYVAYGEGTPEYMGEEVEE